MSSFADVAEARIQEAIENGEFRSLQSAGQPLDLDAYFSAPSSLRAGFSLLKNAGAVPPEVEAMKRVYQLREVLRNTSDPALIKEIRLELQTRETEVTMAMERMRRTIRQDICE